jgi:hypothetical protein
MLRRDIDFCAFRAKRFLGPVFFHSNFISCARCRVPKRHHANSGPVGWHKNDLVTLPFDRESIGEYKTFSKK